MARGDHIRARRFLYRHEGIDCGDGTVIHYTGTPWNRWNAEVRRTALKEFVGRAKKVEIVSYVHESSPDEVMERAEGRLGERKYSLLFNNCEHFATWCKTGISDSGQVRRAAAKTAVAIGAIVVLGGIWRVVKRERAGRTDG